MEISSLVNTAYVYADAVEDEAKKQIQNILELPSFAGEKVRIMPDVHAGKGCVIGFTSTYSNSIIPNLVGVDIGCGMLAVNVGKSKVDLKALDDAASSIPMGFGKNSIAVESGFDYSKLVCHAALGSEKIEHAMLSLGSLGGGNHFIAMEVEDDGTQWIVIHTGSRGFGLSVANYWQAEACKMHPEADPLLASLEGDALKGYLNDVDLCAHWAVLNRKAIAEKLLHLAGLNAVESFETIHNYVDVKHSIVRKGAVAAYEGQKLLIPLNMKDGSLICIGKGNSAWNCSAPHGAGRKMSRGMAKKTVSLEAFKEAMKGIYSTSVCEATLDESPFAYKDANSIIHQIDGETVDVIAHIHPVWNIKAH